MKAKTVKGNSPEEIRSSLQQSMADGFAPTLALVFMSIKQDCDAVCSLLDEEGISILGSTTSGEFIGPDIITKGHGGELKVETQEGEGTTFIISVPANNSQQ